jgi:hypothetical protein
MRRSISSLLLRFGLSVMMAWACGLSRLHADPSFTRTVCTSGCTYSSLASALSSITDNDATHVYTIYLDAGVYAQASSVTWKSYVNLKGRGRGAILRATSGFFTSASDVSLLELSNLTDVAITNVTVDALTNDPGGLDIHGSNWAAVGVTGADRIVLDSTDLRGVSYGIWETDNDAAHHIEVRNASVLGGYAGIGFAAGVWHIFGSEVEGVGDRPASMIEAGYGIYRPNTSHSGKLHIWGSHIHGELSALAGGAVGNSVHGLFLNTGTAPLDVDVVGSTLHAKVGVTNVGQAFEAAAVRLMDNQSGVVTVNVAGSDMLYESPDSMPYGVQAGLYHGRLDATSTINLAGADIRDLGGSLSASCTGNLCARADVVANTGGPGGGSSPQPSVRLGATRARSFKKNGSRTLVSNYASAENTLNSQSGTASFDPPR